MDEEKLTRLLEELVKQPQEVEWLEFKTSFVNPERLGQLVSGLANSAALSDVSFGYLVYGVEDGSHKIVGTKFNPKKEKAGGNQEFENWLNDRISPRTDLEVSYFQYQGKPIALFKVPAAIDTPVKFQKVAYIRIGNVTRPMNEFPSKERKIWANEQRRMFEKALAIEDLNPDQILDLIDFPNYFRLVKKPLPSSKEGIIDSLMDDEIIVKSHTGYGITNMGAILFAQDLRKFEHLNRKSVRIIIYDGKSKVKTIREVSGRKGYAIGFESILNYLEEILPSNEEIRRALRVEKKMYPELALREIIANALIHQDFSETGSGPMIEIFEGRMEITNPGKPLISVSRFLGSSPKSRNEKLAAFMRRMKFCEERGSGIIKIITECEIYQLPAPNFEETENSTRVTFFAPRSFQEMDKQEKIRACSQHCELRYITGTPMTNESLRARFGIKKENYPIASKIIDDTIKAGLIVPFDPENKSKKHAKYKPVWAS